MIAFAFAVLAILSQPSTPPADFISATLGDCHPVAIVGTFVGCEQAHPGDDDAAYAGLVWIDGQPVLQTGP